MVNVTSDTFTHSNGTNTVWSITHNLGKYPSVTVISSAGEEIFGELTFTNANAIQLTFSEAIAGTAYLN